MIQDYALYGWRVRSPIELAGPVPSTLVEPDLLLQKVTAGRVPTSTPNGYLLAQFPSSHVGPKSYWLVSTDECFLLRAPGRIEFRLSPDLTTVTVVRSAKVPCDYVRDYFVGNFMSVLLGLAGHSVFHGAAVTIKEGLPARRVAVAILGGLGAGKSTTAALLASVGANFLTDDVLAVKHDSDTPYVVGGSTEARLRTGAVTICELFPGSPTRATVDNRVALQLGQPTFDSWPLRLLCFPRVTEVTAVNVTRMPAMEVALALAGLQRTLGWDLGRIVRRHFQSLVDIASKVPSVRLDMPRSQKPGAELARSLWAGLEQALKEHP